jgi:RNA polymerase sigma-70 factor, ECF subfamily
MIQEPGPDGDGVACYDDAVRSLVMKAVTTYQTPLLRYAGQILRHQPDSAQDVVQDAFMRLHRKFGAHTRITDIRAWLFRVTHNLAIDHCRRNRRFSPLEQGPTPHVEAEADCGDRKLLVALADQELAELPSEQRQVVSLKIVEGMTFREISEITGEKIPTLHFRLKKGLKKLAQRMEGRR